MGRDKVIGLGLAILLIGFAGAFCFRNDNLVEHGLKLARAKILDDAIAEKPGPKPYALDPKADFVQSNAPAITLQGIEPAEPTSQTQTPQKQASRTQASRTQSPQMQAASPSPESTETARSAVAARTTSPVTIDPLDDAAFGPLPTYEALAAESSPKDARSSSGGATSSEVVDRRSSPQDDEITPQRPDIVFQPASVKRERREPAEEPDDDPNRATNALTHRVQRGDTLSRLALHYLGDGSRYHEIYAANRDQMKSPDDRLQIGMALRIPRASVKIVPNSGSTAARKNLPTARSSRTANGSTRTPQMPTRNVSRIRETQPLPPDSADTPPPKTDRGDDPPPYDRFVPMRRSPFLPGKPRPVTSESSSSAKPVD